MYAIIDIETTGGSAAKDKITEIAIFIHDGQKVVDEYTTLINPERGIPYHITQLTGITNEMVADAPKFYEVAREIVEKTEDRIFVAHNVGFDYRFIRSEFKQLGYDFHRESLCTVKLSRQLIPGHPSYSLGKLCSALNIKIDGRHRAAGDAMANVKLFELLLDISKINGHEVLLEPGLNRSLRNLHPSLKDGEIRVIPQTTGVYYLYDETGSLLYIGKSTNLRQRVMDHLGNQRSKRASGMRDKVASVDYEETGSELVALLLESERIKQDKPPYNRALRHTVLQYGIYSFKDGKGYIRFCIDRLERSAKIPLCTYPNKQEARKVLGNMAEQYWLCQKLCGLYDTDGACFHYGVRQCNGACIGKESVKSYNERAGKVLSHFEYDHENFLIIDAGRSPEERSVVAVENGRYLGYGYLMPDESYLQVEDLLECIQKREDNRDVQALIRSYLLRNKVEKIIRF